MNTMVQRLLRTGAGALVLLAGLIAIVGSGTPAPACSGALGASLPPAAVLEGDSAAIRLTARALVGAPLQWHLSWLAIRADGSSEIVHTTDHVSLTDGAVDEYVLGPTVYTRDNGTHYVIDGTYGCFHGADQVQQLWSVQVVTLSLAVTPALPVWITEPESRSVALGAPATFSASASGDVGYAWERSSDGFITSTPIAGANQESFTIAAASAADNDAQFRVRAASRSTGQVIVSRSATLTVTDTSSLPPSFSAGWRTQPITVTAGSVAIGLLHITQVHGTAANVDLTLTGTPAGLTLTPATWPVPAEVDSDFVINIAASAAVLPGDYAALLRLARAGTVLQDLPVSVTVLAPPRSVAAQAVPDTLLLVPGRGATASVVVTPIVGSTAQVTVQARSLPSGLQMLPTQQSFTGNSAGTPVQVFFPLSFAAGTPLGRSTLEFVTTESGTTALTSTVLDLRAEATASVDTGAAVRTSTTIVAQTTASDGSSLNANLVRGELGLLAPITSSPSRPVISTSLGAPATLQWVNTGGTPVVLPAGSLRMELDGSYFVPAGSALHLQADFSLESGGSALAGRIDHAIGGDVAAPVTATSGGMTVNVARGDVGGLRATIGAPTITLLPGQTLNLTASLRLMQADRTTRIDFWTVPVRVCFAAPSGAELAINTLTSLNWCR